MFPIGDTIRSVRMPVVNKLIVLVNVVVFVYMASLANGDIINLESEASVAFILSWAFTPETLTVEPGTAALTILTSMFMHGGILHLLGNMLFLWIFGDNIEDRLGHIPYLIFYLLGGATAAIVQATLGGAPDAPMLGASGAIGAVLGAYLMLHPASGIRTFLPPFFIFTIPAFIYLPYWAFLQYRSASMGDGGNIAFWAHLGGFIFGFLVVRLVAGPPVAQGRATAMPSYRRR